VESKIKGIFIFFPSTNLSMCLFTFVLEYNKLRKSSKKTMKKPKVVVLLLKNVFTLHPK